MKTEEEKKPQGWREYVLNMKESILVYRWVIRELVNAEAKKWFWRMIGLVVFSTVLYILRPYLVGGLIDGLSTSDMSLVWYALIGCIVASFVQRGVEMLVSVCREYVAGENYIHLEHRTSELFFEKSLGQLTANTDELTASNVEKGRERVRELQNMLLFDGMHVLMSTAISFGALFLISPLVGFLMSLTFLNEIIWMLFLNNRVSTEIGPLDKELRAHTRYCRDRWDRFFRVKAAAKETFEAKHMLSWLGCIIREHDRPFWIWYNLMTMYRSWIRIAIVMGIWGYGIWLVVNGSWTLGVLVPLITWTQMISGDMWRIGHIEHRLNWNMPAVRSMKNALTLPTDIVVDPKAPRVPEGALTIEVRGVSHAYQDGNPVLNNVSLRVDPGDRVALVGPSGAGKSTLMKMFLRAMDPAGGEIRVNGQDLRKVNLDSYLRQIGCIPQRPQVFDGTIRDNLVYVLDETERCQFTDEQLWKILREYKIDLQGRLKEGLDTRVGRDGIRLSGGEQQRLMIAAAMIAKPRLVLIDEATCSLDSSTEKEVQMALERALSQKGCSAVIIAHRLDTLKFCDKVVVLKSATNLQNGEPQIELIADSFEDAYRRSPTFRRLADDQGVCLI